MQGKKRRVAIIGLGASGIFALKRFAGANVEVHVFDVGPPYGKRYACPIVQEILQKCPPDVCGFCAPAESGGILNDGKTILTASQRIGGRLWDLVGKEELQRGLDEVRDTILDHATGNVPIVCPSEDDLAWINGKAAAAGMTYYPQTLLHLGTDRAVETYANILKSIMRAGDNIVFHWNTKVASVSRRASQFVVRHEKNRGKTDTDQEQEDVFDFAILSPGRGGTKWLLQQEFYPYLDTHPGQVDIGVRVETHGSVTAELDRRFYEAKVYYEALSGDLFRSFCNNPLGFVVVENHKDGGYLLVNGHSMKDQKSENCNFAVLGTHRFTRPFRNPQVYAQTVARLVNSLTGGEPLVQRFGDLLKTRRTKSLEGNAVRPTLLAECGDLGHGYPYRTMMGIIEFMMALDKICPGIAGPDTLLYGPECKSYPDLITVSRDMETNIPGLYIIGDASSWTRGVGQAACSGLRGAEGVLRKIAA